MRRRFLLYMCIVMVICGSLGFQVGLYIWHVPPAFPRPAEKQRETFVEEHHVAPPKQTLLQKHVKEYVPPTTTCAKKCLTHLRAYYNHYYGKEIVYERTKGCNIVFREGVSVSRMNVSAYEAIEHAVNRIDGNTAICMINKCDSRLFEQRAKDIWWIGNEQGVFHLDRTKKFAYVWWTSISEYTWSAIVAIKSLKAMNPDKQIDFVLIHTITLSNEQQQILDTYGVKCISFKNTVHVRNSYFKYANNKLYVFKLTQYDRVLFMDSDSMPLRNMDHMFMFPDAPIVAPCSYWEPEQQPKLTAWIILIQPNNDSFDRLIKRASEKPGQTEMDTLNDVFRDEMLLLPSYYGLLNSEWERGDKTYHLHGDSIFEQAPIVHYTIKGKPWHRKKGTFKGSTWDEAVRVTHNKWWQLRHSDMLPPLFRRLRADQIFVRTGDIHDMWIRDSAAQVWPYRNDTTLVTDVLNMQRFFIEHDPYANSYRDHEVPNPSHADKRLGRTGWIATRNYELDSGCYFIRLLYHAWKHHQAPLETYRNAVRKLVDVWKTEQYHEEKSPYRYPELPRNGLGSPVAYTGMTWSGFRPSDDACKYGYHIPSNLFAAESLGRVMEMYPAMGDVSTLRDDILRGVETYGTWQDGDVRRYCYEVDGLGNCNKMDDANVPSLLSIPYLNTVYDREVWQHTYEWIWSPENPYFFEGKAAEGIGSPHTPKDYIWPMSMIMRGLVDASQCEAMKRKVKETMTRGTIHESFHKDHATKLTREEFAWPNALFTEMSCKLSVSIGIPAIWNDKHDILNAIKSVEQQTILPKEIVIVMSGVPANENPTFDSSVPIRIFTENALHYAGWARNKIASLASGNWIAYIDADDTMHRKRIETFYTLYTPQDILVLHSHAPDEKIIDSPITIISGEQLLKSALTTGNTMPLLPDGVHNIQHGHPIVKKSLFDSIKYDEGLRRGQDTEFLHRAIKHLKGQGVKYIHAPLSIYENTREAKKNAVRDVELYGHYADKKVPFYMYSVPKYTSCIEGHSKIYNWYKRYKHGGELWWYEQLTRSPWRTSNPRDAKVFVMPLFAGLSAYKNICKAELIEALSNIKSHQTWNNGIAHLLLTTHFTTMNINCGKCIRLRQANTNRANQGHISTPMVGQLDFEGNERYQMETPIPFWKRNNLLYFAGQADNRVAYTSRREVRRVFDKLGYPFIVCSAKSMPCAEKFKENMFNTKFGMHIRGDLPSSSRLYEWITTKSIPIMVSDKISKGWLPGVHIPWNDFSIQIKEHLPDDQLEQKLKEIITMDKQKINTMLETLGNYRTMLMWQHPKSIVSEMLLIDAYEYLNNM